MAWTDFGSVGAGRRADVRKSDRKPHTSGHPRVDPTSITHDHEKRNEEAELDLEEVMAGRAEEMKYLQRMKVYARVLRQEQARTVGENHQSEVGRYKQRKRSD